jgi:hypothetical protein
MRVTPVLALVCAVATPSLAAGPTTVLVLPLEAKGGAAPDLAQLTTSAVTVHASKVPGFRVISFSEVQGLLTQEQLKQAVGCDSAGCAAEIAGSLNSDEIVIGSLGKVGGSLLLTMTRVRARDAQVVGRAMERVPGQDEDVLLDRLAPAVTELFGAGAPGSPGSLPPPAAGLRRYVSAVSAPCLEQAAPRSPVLRTLGIGAEVIVSDPPVVSQKGIPYRAVLGGGAGAGGFIRDDVLVAAPPSLDAAMEAARTALTDLDLTRAAAEGERAAALAPTEKEPLELLGALYDAQSKERAAARVYARLKDLGGRTTTPDPPAAAAAGPALNVGKAYVSGTRVRLRAGPDTTTPILAEIRLNSEVQVRGLEGTWARVAWSRAQDADPEGSSFLDLAAQDGTRGDETRGPGGGTSAEAMEGFVLATLLSPTPTSAEAMVKEADALEASGQKLQAVARLARAAILKPDDVALLKRLVRVATEERQYQIAAWTAVSVGWMSLGSLAVLRLAYGCRGNEDEAVWLPQAAVPAKQPGKGPRDSCVENVDVEGACPPCPPRRGSGPAHQKALKAHAAEVKRHRAQAAEHQKSLARLREAYPRGPWLRAELTGPTDPGQRKLKLFAYALPLGTAAEGGRVALVDQVRVSSASAAWPAPGKRGVVWVKAPRYDGVVLGLVKGEDAASARQAVLARFDKVRTLSSDAEVAARAPLPNVVGPTSDCRCGGD